MVQTNYSYSAFTDKTAKAYGKSLPISTKVAINICNALRGLPVNKALAYLQDVLDEKRAIPFTRFSDGVGHRPGIGAGRYPKKASQAIAEIIASAANNAAVKGLSTDLKIVAIVANKASSPLHYGRQRRRSMKRTHIEVVVEEMEGATPVAKKTPKKAKTTTEKSLTKKTAEKKTSKKDEPGAQAENGAQAESSVPNAEPRASKPVSKPSKAESSGEDKK